MLKLSKVSFLVLLSFVSISAMEENEPHLRKSASKDHVSPIHLPSTRPMDAEVAFELSKMQNKEKNPKATMLHAAAKLGFIDWLNAWVIENKKNPEFKDLLRNMDSNNNTPIAIANYSVKIEFASRLQELLKDNPR